MAIELNNAFRPALNPQGLAKITFKTSGEATGKRKADDSEYKTFQFVFEVMSAIRGQAPKLIKVNASFTLDAANPSSTRLGQLLLALGFEFPIPTLVEDEDGFGVEGEATPDEDGFAVEEDNLADLAEQIEAFLPTAEDKVFTGKVAQNKQGYWDIDIASLQPFVKKAK